MDVVSFHVGWKFVRLLHVFRDSWERSVQWDRCRGGERQKNNLWCWRQLWGAVMKRSMETLGRDSVDCMWEVLNRNGFSSELATSNTWSPFTPDCVEYADKVGKLWDQRAFLGLGKMGEPKFVMWKPLFLMWRQRRMRCEKDERRWKCVSGNQKELGEQSVFHTRAILDRTNDRASILSCIQKRLSESGYGKIRTGYIYVIHFLKFSPNVHHRTEGNWWATV